MARNIYALLVGINDYAPTVGKLSGCINDVDHFHSYLTDNFDKSMLRVEVLKDADATRPNVIKQFRTHLGRAKAGDVAVFQYCGHGARCKSAKAFERFYPDGKDEGLVCYDSRSPAGFDLADKELAVLLVELAKNEPHIAVILDSCHSGSATRSADDFTQLKARQTHEVFDERPLESYLDGYYAKLSKGGRVARDSGQPSYSAGRLPTRSKSLGRQGPQRRVHQHAARSIGKERDRYLLCRSFRALSDCGSSAGR